MNAEEVIKLYERLETDQTNFRTLWQNTADVLSPGQNQIVTRSTPGGEKTIELYDTTGRDDAADMAAGLCTAFIPSGQKFFNIVPTNKDLTEVSSVWRYLGLATETLHSLLFESNFILEISSALNSLGIFGTALLYSEWSRKLMGLNYRDYPIGSYVLREGESGQVDTTSLKKEYTARQALEKFGKNCGPKVFKSAQDAKTENDPFVFIHYVGPRENRNLQYKTSWNMPFESLWVNQSERLTVEEGGFERFPFAAARWMKSSDEIYGRGQGTESVPKIRTLQQLWKDLVECGNKTNNPAREVLANEFEGSWKTKAGGINLVSQLPASRPIESGNNGAFPITKDLLEFQQANVGRTFYKDVFAPLMDLKGDRRTTLEIIERLKEGLRKLAMPAMRAKHELFTPVITRSFLLAIKHGAIDPPPDELLGENFDIQYEGQIEMALRSQQARGFQQMVAWLAGLEQLIPGCVDHIDEEGAIPRMGRSFGMNEEDLATEEQVAAKRKRRADKEQKLQMAQAAQVASEAYKNTSKKAEEGSLAEQFV